MRWRAGLLRALDAAVGRRLPQSLAMPDYLADLDPLDMSLFEGDLGARGHCLLPANSLCMPHAVVSVKCPLLRQELGSECKPADRMANLAGLPQDMLLDAEYGMLGAEPDQAAGQGDALLGLPDAKAWQPWGQQPDAAGVQQTRQPGTEGSFVKIW
jgi:hypothetical protein